MPSSTFGRVRSVNLLTTGRLLGMQWKDAIDSPGEPRRVDRSPDWTKCLTRSDFGLHTSDFQTFVVYQRYVIRPMTVFAVYGR